jgi:ABC-type oligopeptide transport system substrate-binding subunit
VLPELAMDWEASEDGKVYRFRMRQDALWSNGEPVTAHDVVWAVRRNIDPETASPYAYMLFVLENAQAIHEGESDDMESLGVTAVEDYLVEFRLVEPAAYFPAMVGVWVYRPLPRKVLEEHGERWTDPWNIVTSGSYRLATWKRNNFFLLERNPHYYEVDKVAIDKVKYIVVPESSVGLAMYKSDELDILGAGYLPLPAAEIPRILADPELSLEYHNEPNLCTYYYGFNNSKPPLDDPLVRKAISAAVDRQMLIDVVTQGDEEPAHTFTRPPIFGAVRPEEGVGIHFDPEQAALWLAEAGYPEGEGFPPLDLYYNTSETHERIARGVQTFLKHYLNIQVALKPTDWDAFMDVLDSPNQADIFRFGWCADYPDANNWLNEVFHPQNSANRIHWSNDRFTELVEQASSERDLEQRKAMYKEAERILTEEQAAIMPLYFYTAPYLVKSRVVGWYHIPLGGQHIRNWKLQ